MWIRSKSIFCLITIILFLQEMFGGKEKATIIPLMSMAERDDLNLSRMNPVIDRDKSDMADFQLMEYWRERGKKYAKLREEAIIQWARYLYDESKHKDKIVDEYNKTKTELIEL